MQAGSGIAASPPSAMIADLQVTVRYPLALKQALLYVCFDMISKRLESRGCATKMGDEANQLIPVLIYTRGMLDSTYGWLSLEHGLAVDVLDTEPALMNVKLSQSKTIAL